MDEKVTPSENIVFKLDRFNGRQKYLLDIIGDPMKSDKFKKDKILEFSLDVSHVPPGKWNLHALYKNSLKGVTVVNGVASENLILELKKASGASELVDVELKKALHFRKNQQFEMMFECVNGLLASINNNEMSISRRVKAYNFLREYYFQKKDFVNSLKYMLIICEVDKEAFHSEGEYLLSILNTVPKEVALTLAKDIEQNIGKYFPEKSSSHASSDAVNSLYDKYSDSSP